MTLNWEQLLQLGALVLSVVNGLILVRVHMRDKARLKVSPIHSDTYQWWFRAPDGTHGGAPTRRFGFLVYAGIANKGHRAVTLDGWRLEIRARNGKRAELRALSIPQPMFRLGEIVKTFAVLGQKTELHDGRMRVDSGDSLSGMALYVYECFGPEAWNPAVGQRRLFRKPLANQIITGRFTVRDVFGGRSRSRFDFQERSFAQMEQMIPGLRELFSAVDAGWPREGPPLIERQAIGEKSLPTK